MNKKENQGFQRTHLLIEETLLQIAKEQGFRQVTVRELCARCGINRSTFYAHFQDLFAVMESIKGRMDAGVGQRLQELTQQSGRVLSFADWITAMLEQVRCSRDFYSLYLSRNDLEYLNHGFREMREGIMEPAFRLFQVPEASRKYYSSFFLAGFLNTIRLWLESGCIESPQELCGILIRMMPEITEEVFQSRFS